jgi:diguanylate cyclase (GGDEF)-like protein
VTDSFADTLLEFRREFLSGAFERLAEMEALVGRMAGPSFEESLRKLGHHLHGLAGAGGTYGFPEVSAIASAGEEACAAALASRSKPGERELAEWSRRIRSIRAALRGPDAADADTEEARDEDTLATDVLIVDDDPEIVAFLSTVCEREGFQVRTASDLARARREVEARVPAGIFLDIGLPDGSGLPLVEVVRDLPGGDSAAILVVSGAGDFANRVEAIHCGADGYFLKPLDVGALFRRLHHVIARRSLAPPRILSVEEDAGDAAFVREVLEAAGYDVRACGDASHFAADAASFRPDLVLLETAFAGETTGYELARYLRQEEGNATLPIVFLSARGGPDDRIAAIRAGGDDLLAKPVSPALLLATVAARIERSRFVNRILRRDPPSTLLTPAAFGSRLAATTERLRRSRQDRAALLVFDVDGLAAINEVHGHAAGDRVLAALGSLLTRRMRHSDGLGRLRGGEVAFVVEEMDGQEARQLVARLGGAFAAISHSGEEGDPFRASISAGVAGFGPRVHDAGQWMAAAQTDLEETKRLRKSDASAGRNSGKRPRRSPGAAPAFDVSRLPGPSVLSTRRPPRGPSG